MPILHQRNIVVFFYDGIYYMYVYLHVCRLTVISPLFQYKQKTNPIVCTFTIDPRQTFWHQTTVNYLQCIYAELFEIIHDISYIMYSVAFLFMINLFQTIWLHK